ncbi:hypothetical protein A7A09_014200 [Paracoccus methylarcula]|uniref:Transposase IS66 C-terminal domain-containing protein n=1 Tax=Paracoccus methylarcula TaxID=72022 RepID=A0A422QVP0_9RHOB|nr:hypothetical protein A7A09_014200 [Paracoccus methylarcula]
MTEPSTGHGTESHACELTIWFRQGVVHQSAVAAFIATNNDLTPYINDAWLIWVLGRIADQKMTRLDDLLPWKYAALIAKEASDAA